MFPAQLTSGTPGTRPPAEVEIGQGARLQRLIGSVHFSNSGAVSIPLEEQHEAHIPTVDMRGSR